MKYEESTKIILKVLFAFLALAFLWFIRDIVIILLLSLILASALNPLVDYFSKKKIPRAVCVIIVYLAMLGIATLVIYLIIPPVIQQYKFLQDNLPQYSAALQDRLGPSFNASDFFKQLLGGISGGNVVSSTFGLFNGVISFISVLVISFYLVAEEKGMNRFIASFLPSQHQESTLSLLKKLQVKMGKWVMGQLFASLSIFVLVFLGLSFINLVSSHTVPYILVLALLAGLLEVVPYIGPILSSVPAIFFAFLVHPPLAIAVAVLYLIIHQIEGYVLVPKIMQKAVGTSPLLVLIALLIGLKLAGPIGVLVAVPLATAASVIMGEFWPEARVP